MEQKRSALFIGASRGIGRSFALEAARRGISPTAVARRFDPDDTELLKAALPIHADVGSAIGMEYLRRENIWLSPYVFWTAGAYQRKRFADLGNLDLMLDMHQRAMLEVLQIMHRSRLTLKDSIDNGPAVIRPRIPEMLAALPYTLVVMGSISSYKLRPGEAVYAMAKAGQAAFLRNYASELAEDFPGSRIFLVNCARLGSEPGEQKTDAGGKRIDPAFVARTVWNLLGDAHLGNRPYIEINIERSSSEPSVIWGPQVPEAP